MKEYNIKKITINGLMIALVVISTLIIQVPTISTSGYINLGDSIILLSGYFLGPVTGFLAGGFGSALADLISGHTHWTIFSFIIKGSMGALMGLLTLKSRGKKFFSPMVFIAPILVEAFMVVGYLIAGTILKGSFMVSLASVPSNIVQGIGGVALFLVLGKALSKTNIKELNSMKGDNIIEHKRTINGANKKS